MADQFPQITLDPALTAQSNPQPKPEAPATVASTAQSVPLQPIPPVSTARTIEPLPKMAAEPLPAAAPLPVNAHADISDRRSVVQAELERLQAEESSLLNNIKDWLTKVQGAETKQQALERELFALDRQLASVPSPAQLASERAKKIEQYTTELKQAESKIKEITKLQKIDEKKAFDNYSAGGLDRQGLLDSMETIRQRYAEQLTAVQKLAEAAQHHIETIDQPAKAAEPATLQSIAEVVTPVQETVEEKAEEKKPEVTKTEAATPMAAPSTTAGSPLMQKLAALPEATTGLLHHLVVELPNQGTWPMIGRSGDGTGIIISENAQSVEHCFIADADLLRAGATAEDIIPLPTSQLTSKEATPLTSPAA